MSQVGFRGWTVDKDGALQAMNQEVYPPDSPLEATCIHYDRAVEAEKARRKNCIVVAQPLEETKVSDGGGKWHAHGKPPSFHCSCGIYLFKWGEDVEGLIKGMGYNSIRVMGVCEWWGEYVEHEIGWRVQFAQPRALFVVGGGKLHPVYHHLVDPSIKRWEDLVERWETEPKKKDPA